MTGKKIMKYKPVDTMKGVAEKIKSTFVSLIPDEEWERLVKKEVDKFFKRGEVEGYSRTRVSDFEELVNELLKKECKARVLKLISDEVFTNQWDNQGKRIFSKEMENMFVANSGQILTSFIGGMFSDMIQDYTNRQQNQY